MRIKIKMDELIKPIIQEKAEEKIRGRRVILEMEIAITKEGEVLVR